MTLEAVAHWLTGRPITDLSTQSAFAVAHSSRLATQFLCRFAQLTSLIELRAKGA
jgi:hypothetical protein